MGSSFLLALDSFSHILREICCIEICCIEQNCAWARRNILSTFARYRGRKKLSLCQKLASFPQNQRKSGTHTRQSTCPERKLCRLHGSFEFHFQKARVDIRGAQARARLFRLPLLHARARVIYRRGEKCVGAFDTDDDLYVPRVESFFGLFKSLAAIRAAACSSGFTGDHQPRRLIGRVT